MNAQLDTRQRSPMQDKIIAYNESLNREIKAREDGTLTSELTDARKQAYADLLAAQADYLKSIAA